MGVIKAAKQLGLRIPEDIALTSMGGSVIGDIAEPALTTVDFDPERHGMEAAKMLLEVIAKKRITPFHQLLPVHLVIRQSA
jgi:DNA-binding LacI/PurR family transcriptional regulator